MKTYYLIRGFYKYTQNVFVTDPGLFETEEEAIKYCEKHSTKSLMLGYSLIRVGKMK